LQNTPVQFETKQWAIIRDTSTNYYINAISLPLRRSKSLLERIKVNEQLQDSAE